MRDLTRIGSSVLASLVAGLYAVIYNNSMTAIVLPCDFGDQRLQVLPSLTRFAIHADLWWFVLPGVLLGLALHFRRKLNPDCLQLTVSATWLLSLTWILLVHIAWLLPLLPLCSPVVS